MIALKIAHHLKWALFYEFFVHPSFSFGRNKELKMDYLARLRMATSDLEMLYPFLTWEFPLEP